MSENSTFCVTDCASPPGLPKGLVCEATSLEVSTIIFALELLCEFKNLELKVNKESREMHPRICVKARETLR